MKIIITGGCGFIGTNIALKALSRGYKVMCFDSFVRKGTEENAEIIKKAGGTILQSDVRYEKNINNISHIAWDGIIHLAANPGVPWSIKDPIYDFQVNVGGTLNMLELARKRRTPFLFASTNKVYSNLVDEEGFYNSSIDELTPVDGLSSYHHSPYGVSKLAADEYVQEYFHTYGVPTVVNRMSAVYGLFQKGVEDQGWVDWFVRQIGFGNQELTIYGDGNQVRDLVFGSDLAALYIQELEQIEKVKGQVFNIGGGEDNALSLKEAIKYIETLAKKKAILTFKDRRLADHFRYVSDISKITSFLDWKPTISPKEGIKQMYQQYENSHFNK